MTPAQKYDTPRASDRLCAGCMKPAIGFGCAYKYKSEILWACGNPDCYLAIQGTYTMSTRDFAKLDTEAAEIGGQEGGAYLETLGRYALDTLTPEEYAEYVRVVIGAYRNALHVTLRDASPF